MVPSLMELIDSALAESVELRPADHKEYITIPVKAITGGLRRFVANTRQSMHVVQ
jgi:hypothetical protein